MKNAVKMESLEGVSVNIYVEKIAEMVEDKEILAASRMNRSVVVFLKTTNSVDIICTNGLTITEEFIQPQPMVKPATKVILSNVPPFLPNELLAEKLEPYGKVITQSFRYIPLGCRKDSLRHVKSFRRQVYIVLKQGNINGVLHTFYNGNSYSIYISTDEVRCFHCKDTGHIRRNCPSLQQNREMETNPESQQQQHGEVDDSNNTELDTSEAHITEAQTATTE